MGQFLTRIQEDVAVSASIIVREELSASGTFEVRSIRVKWRVKQRAKPPLEQLVKLRAKKVRTLGRRQKLAQYPSQALSGSGLIRVNACPSRALVAALPAVSASAPRQAAGSNGEHVWGMPPGTRRRPCRPRVCGRQAGFIRVTRIDARNGRTIGPAGSAHGAARPCPPQGQPAGW